MTLAQRLQEIQSRVIAAAESTGRDPGQITLIAVSKTQPASAIQALYDLGHRDFGESRWQEALAKIESLPADIRWHFIGNLQSNKATEIIQRFGYVHTLCRTSQLSAIAQHSKSVKAFIQVNIGEECQKGGIFPDFLDPFLQNALQYPQVHCQGLMAIGPQTESAEATRPYYRKLAELARSRGLSSISMGMSGDFEVAIQEGSTHIRVGTALFGERK